MVASFDDDDIGYLLWIATNLGLSGSMSVVPGGPQPVSYTHLTLPTNREV